MKASWHEHSRQFVIIPQGREDEEKVEKLKRRGLARYDAVRRVYWVGEVCWADLYEWGWEDYNLHALFKRYTQDKPGGAWGAPIGCAGLPFFTNPDYLKPYQKDAIERARFAYLTKRRGYGIYLPMGTGKTALALALFRILQRADNFHGMLVVCPKRVIGEWYAEWGKHLGGMPGAHEFLAINYESLRTAKGLDAVRQFVGRRKVLLVADEAHSAGNGESRLTQGLIAVAGLCAFVVPMTGTPVRNRPTSFLPIYRISTGAVITEQQFARKFPERLYPDGRRLYKNLEQFAPIFRSIGYRKSEEELGLDLPPPTVRLVTVPLSPQQRSQYTQMAQEFYATLTSMKDEEFRVTARSGLAQVTRLLQISSHPGLLGDSVNDGYVERMKVVDEILTEAGNEKAVVWSRHPDILERVAFRHPDRMPVVLHGKTVKSDRWVDAEKTRFNTDPACTLGCFSVSAFGQGLNLQEACRLAIYWDLTWAYEKHSQSMKRLDRLGQTRRVHIVVLLGQDTIDPYIWRLLTSKRQDEEIMTGVPSGRALTEEMTREGLMEALRKGLKIR